MKEFTLSLCAESDGVLLSVPLDASDMDSTLLEICTLFLGPIGSALYHGPAAQKMLGVGHA